MTNGNDAAETMATLSSSPSPGADAARGRLCLNMIVRNESRIIRRLLKSARPIIDRYCICDTGSTDGTVDIIRAYMSERGVPGEVYSEPFRDFGFNRTHALERAARWADWALLLDADMILEIGDFSVDQLYDRDTGGGGVVPRNARFSVLQKSSIEYYNTRIVRTGVGVRCVCPTHEYYDRFPAGCQVVRLPETSLRIADRGDGGCKSDKFERDIRLLTEALEADPDNPRYHFYLAQSYHHIGGREKDAIRHYERRVEIGGWAEEAFYAAFKCGCVYDAIGEPERAVYWWLRAYQILPSRAETLHQLVVFYRKKGMPDLALMFCERGMTVPFPADQDLFIDGSVYRYKFDYEYSLLIGRTPAVAKKYIGRPVGEQSWPGWLANRYMGMLAVSHDKANVLHNLQFLVRPLADAESSIVDLTERAADPATNLPMVSSTPCIFKLHEHDAAGSPCDHGETACWGVCVRYVNYRIRSDGTYEVYHPEQKLVSRCKWRIVGRGPHSGASHSGAPHSASTVPFIAEGLAEGPEPSPDPDRRYLGTEDVRIFPLIGHGYMYIGTVQTKQPDGSWRLTIGHGRVGHDASKTLMLSAAQAIASPTGQHCEKNWSLAWTGRSADPTQLSVVYSWSPLAVYRFTNADKYGVPTPECATLTHVRTHTEVPAFFRLVRGSTSGVYIWTDAGPETWFVVHLVEPSRPRKYYHMIVALNPVDLSYRRHSMPFCFVRPQIEFCLGFEVERHQRTWGFSEWEVVFSFSENDRTSKILRMPLSKAEALFPDRA